MKTKLLFLITFLAMAGGGLWAQSQQSSYSNPVGGNITASGANCANAGVCVWQKLPVTATTTTVTITGTFSETLIIETSADGGNTFTQQSSQTAPIVVTFTTTSLTDVRVRGSAFTSGNAGVNIQTAGNQQNITINSGSSSGGGGLGSPVTSGLIGQYQILPTENPCTLADISGSGNNFTGCTGTAPTIIPVTGGISCAGTGATNFPAALNGTVTMQVFMSVNVGVSSNISLATFLVATNDQLVIAGNAGTANSMFWRLYQSSFPATAYGQEIQGAGRFRTGNGVASVYLSSSTAAFNGTNSAALVMANPDIFYTGATLQANVQTGNSVGKQISGNLQLCGVTPNYLTGKVYYVLMYNRALSAAEIAQNALFLQNAMAARGVFVSVGGTDNIDQFVPDGDSITSAANWPGDYLNGTFAISDQGVSGTGAVLQGPLAIVNIDPYFRKFAARNVVSFAYGANDVTNVAGTDVLEGQLAAGYCRARRAVGWKCGVSTMISHTNSETGKDKYNATLRQQIPTNFDFIVDNAANLNLGADGACSNTTYFNVDCIHPTTFAEKYIYGANFIHAYNRAGGNPNNTNAAVYKGVGTTIPAPVVLQDCSAVGVANATLTCTFPFANASGNFIFVTAACAVQAGVTVSTIADSKVNTYNLVTAQASQHAGDSTTIGEYAMNIGAGANTITVTYSGLCNNAYVKAYEYKGVLTAAALDATSVMAVGSSTAPASAAITTTAANELVISYIGLYNGVQQITAGNSSNPRGPFVSNHLYFQDRIAVTAGSYTGAATLNVTDNWAIATVAFKTVAGTTNYDIQDADCFFVACQCDPTGGNVNLNLPDGSWDTFSTLTIKNIQTAGANTCTVSGVTPLATGVAQQIDGAGSVTIANKATLKVKPNLTFTGVAGTNLSPVVNWIQLQNN